MAISDTLEVPPLRVGEKLGALILLLRPISWMPFYFPLTLALYQGSISSFKDFGLAFLLTGPLLSGTVYIWNFYSDRELDKRSLVVKDMPMAEQGFASGAVRAHEGLFLSIVTGALSLYLAALFSQTVLYLAVALLLLGGGVLLSAETERDTDTGRSSKWSCGSAHLLRRLVYSRSIV